MKISIINFWNGFNYKNNFIIDVIKKEHNHIELCDNIKNCKILITGPFISETDKKIILTLNCKKILFITEPIEKYNHYQSCYSLYLNNHFDIIFGCINNDIVNNKIKFPLYILYINISNDLFFNNINQTIKNKAIFDLIFCTLISTHDSCNTRTKIYNKLKKIGHITCPSKLFNNCSNDELNKIGNVSYISKFLFHICPENSKTNVDGYITEKLMNCCLGGAIPIYCGWIDNIDAKIFNKNRILFYNPEDEQSIQDVYNKVKELMDDPIKLKKFYSQDIFMPSAYDTIKFMDNNLKCLFNKI